MTKEYQHLPVLQDVSRIQTGPYDRPAAGEPIFLLDPLVHRAHLNVTF